MAKPLETSKFAKAFSVERTFFYLDVSAIFVEVRCPCVKFDEKHDTDFAELVPPTVLELLQNFRQKWSPGPPKIVSPKVRRRIRIRAPQKIWTFS